MLELCLHDMNLNFDQTLNTCICIPKLIIQDINIKKIEIVDIKSCLSPLWFNNFLASCKMSRYYVGKYTSPTAAVPLYEHLSEVIQLFKKEVEIPPMQLCRNCGCLLQFQSWTEKKSFKKCIEITYTTFF